MDPQETDDATEALMQVWPWLSLGGPHFTGGFGVNTTSNQVEVILQMSNNVPKGTGKFVNRFIKGYLKWCGWRALDFQHKKLQLCFTMKPWPLHEQEAARQRSEDYRREARKRRVENLKEPEDAHTPEP